MTVRIVSALARPDLADQADEATAGAFPEYNTHGDVAALRWSRLYEEYPAYQLVLWDDATGEVLGEANTLPCRFDGTVQGLPRGIDEVLTTCLPEVGVPPEPTALCALAIAIPSKQENRGQSRLLLEGMRMLAAERGWAQLIAPVRPNWKHAIRSPRSSGTRAGPARTGCRSTRGCGCMPGWVGGSCAPSPSHCGSAGRSMTGRGGLGWRSRRPGGMCSRGAGPVARRP
jgi:hypothetical protein